MWGLGNSYEDLSFFVVDEKSKVKIMINVLTSNRFNDKMIIVLSITELSKVSITIFFNNGLVETN